MLTGSSVLQMKEMGKKKEKDKYNVDQKTQGKWENLRKVTACRDRLCCLSSSCHFVSFYRPGTYFHC